ncbi:MAG: ABC transporter permease [Candidatus Dormibacteria bacterium]
MKHRVGRPKWWPLQERDEPLTLPASMGTWTAVAAMLGGIALLLEVILPALQGPSARPPLGVLFNGAVYGSLEGLLAVGLILVYRTTRIINFAQVALGSVAGAFVFQMVGVNGLPYVAVVPVALILAGVVGGLTDVLFVRRFFNAPRLVLTIATIAFIPGVEKLVGTILSLLDPVPPGVSPAQAALRTIPTPFPNFHFTIAPFRFGFAHVFALGGVAMATLLVTVWLRWTRLGQAIRGAAENSESAWLLGINIKMLSTLVWAVAGVLAGLVSVFRLTLSGIDTSNPQPELLLPALVAAMVGGMEMMPMALFFGVWFAVLTQGVYWAFPNLTFAEPALLLTMLVALVLQRRRLQRRESKQGTAWQAVKDIRPTPKELEALPFVVWGRLIVWVGGFALLLVFPLVASAGQTHAGGLVLIYALIAISLIILAGWAGQISLGQFALVAVGAVVGSGLTTRFGWSFWVALPVASMVGAALAVALGLPALRLKGLYLAAVTLAFAAAVPALLFDQRYFGWLLPTGNIERPSIFGVSLTSERSFYYLLLIVTGCAVYVAHQLRRTRPGRVLIALRDNEPAAQSVGISPLATRIAAFAVAGFIAAFAGVLLVHYQQTLRVSDYAPQASLDVFLMVVLGGLGNVTGAISGALFGAGLQLVIPQLSGLVTGIGVLGVLLLMPGGLSQVIYAVRDAAYRVLALRLNIVVPSLFEDYDVDAHRRREMPLARPIQGVGLQTLPVTRRYALRSWLWRENLPAEEPHG